MVACKCSCSPACTMMLHCGYLDLTPPIRGLLAQIRDFMFYPDVLHDGGLLAAVISEQHTCMHVSQHRLVACFHSLRAASPAHTGRCKH